MGTNASFSKLKIVHSFKEEEEEVVRKDWKVCFLKELTAVLMSHLSDLHWSHQIIIIVPRRNTSP